jgi:hypothetical protein
MDSRKDKPENPTKKMDTYLRHLFSRNKVFLFPKKYRSFFSRLEKLGWLKSLF